MIHQILKNFSNKNYEFPCFQTIKHHGFEELVCRLNLTRSEIEKNSDDEISDSDSPVFGPSPVIYDIVDKNTSLP